MKFLLFFLLLFNLSFIYPLNINVKIGYNDYVVPNHWNPIIISLDQFLENGRIEISNYSEIDPKIEKTEVFQLDKLEKIESTFFYNPEFRHLNIKIFSNKFKLFENNYDLFGKNFPGNVILTLNIPNKIQDELSTLFNTEEKVLVLNINSKDFFSSYFNYDSITGVIIDDPGLILNPAQVDSLKQYITSGGRVILFTKKSMQDSIISLLIDENNIYNDNYKIGFGEVVVIKKEISEIGNEYFDFLKILDLKSYNKNNILSPSNIFNAQPYEGFIDIEKRNKALSILTFFLTTWVIVNIIFLIILNKKLFIYFIFINLILFILSFYFGNYISTFWQKGIKTTNKAVIFLNSNNSLFSIYINNKDRSSFKPALSQGSSIWGVKFNIDDFASGQIDPKKEKKSLLINNSLYSKASMKHGSFEDIEVIGLEKIDKKWTEFFYRLINNQEIASVLDDEIMDLLTGIFLIEDSKIFIRSPNKLTMNIWETAMAYPDKLKHYSTFINHIIELYPDKKILLGEADLSLLDLFIEKGKYKRVLFIIIN